MGLHTDKKIYGVSLKLDNNILIDTIFEEELYDSQILEIKGLYDSLTLEEKFRLYIRCYISCSYETNIFRTWLPGDICMIECLLQY
jgi:hypothetical protein